MKKQMQKGFTLIELMVVIVIIGILAAIAIPSYLDNANRAKITEGVNMLGPIKSAVAESYIGLGSFPVGAHTAVQDQLGIGAPTDYKAGVVASITYNSATPGSVATLVIAYDQSKLGAGVTGSTDQLTFTATGTATGVRWNCKGGAEPLPDKYRPANCRGT